jgi:predicted metal-binding protein
MADTTIHICVTCRAAEDPLEVEHGRAGARLHKAVADLAAERNAPVRVVGVECLSVCKRPCTVGYAAPGKWTYVYGDFPAETGADTILAGALLYGEAAEGLIPWKQRPDALKKGVVARTPPLAPAPSPSPAPVPPFAEAAE